MSGLDAYNDPIPPGHGEYELDEDPDADIQEFEADDAADASERFSWDFRPGWEPEHEAPIPFEGA